MKILLLGVPGAGKGTQAKIISKRLKIPIISMGDMLREMIKTDACLKEKVLPYMKSGGLVPNEIVGEILKKRVLKEDCKNGFILDGYPRNKEQAKTLNLVGINLDFVIEIFVSEEEILKRLSSRRVCKNCGETFSEIFKKPKKEGVCDLCQAELVLRPDDQEQTIKKRLEVFKKETKPLEDFYKDQNMFFVVDGNQSVELVEKEIFLVLEGKND